MLATEALLCAGAGELLGRFASGEQRAALMTPWSMGFPALGGDAPPPHPVHLGGDGRVSGTVRAVADAVGADVLLVPVTVGGGPGATALLAVDAEDATVTPRGGLDRTRTLADVTLEGVSGTEVAGGPGAVAALQRALLVGAAVLACEQVGLADRCLETAVAYTKERHQFGRPVGSFQALKHRMADVWVANAQARAVARWAVDAVAEDDEDAPVAVATAQAHCSPAAVHAAEECVQLHGGIGFTWENPSHLYLKRAQADALALGTAAAHRTHLAGLVDLSPA